MDKTDLKYQEEEQESYAVVAAEAVEPTSLGVAPEDANQQAKNVIAEDDEALALSGDFIRFLCCAFTCSNHDYPTNFGFKSGGTLLCLESRVELFRLPQNDPKACLTCFANSLECIYPRKCYRDYRQCFCFECFAQFPIPENGIRKLPKLAKERDITSNFAPASNVLFCCGDCFSMYSCSCDFPSCIGSYRKGVCVCTEFEDIRMKPMCCVDNKPDPHTLCVVSKSHLSLVMPYTCWKYIGQTCCLDFRSAFPCDEEVPCIYSLCCFCTACVAWQCNVTCCKTIAQITGNDGKSIAARQQQEQLQAQQQQFQAQQLQFQVEQQQFQAQQQQAPQQVPMAQAQVIQVEMTEMTPSAPTKHE